MYIYIYTHISYQMSVGDRCQLVGWRFGRLICWMVVGMFVGWSVGWAVLWWFGFGVWLPLLFAFRDCFFWGGKFGCFRTVLSFSLCFFLLCFLGSRRWGYGLLFLCVLVGPCCVLSVGFGFRVYCWWVCWFDGSVG